MLDRIRVGLNNPFLVIFMIKMKPEVRKPSESEREKAKNWPTWEKEASTFPWEYDQKETCLWPTD